MTKRKTQKDFITDASAAKPHFDYSSTLYVKNKTRVNVRCTRHNLTFSVLPTNLLMTPSGGCRGCKRDVRSLSRSHTCENFIEKAIAVHGTKYDYSEVEYINARLPVIIKCYRHGRWIMIPNNHTSNKQGCPSCRGSRGESMIAAYLTKHNILFKREYSFDGCRYKLPLRFDFWIPSKNIAIEFQGIQHFQVSTWSADPTLNVLLFEETQIRDKIKQKFCKISGITLIQIRFDDDLYSILRLAGLM